MKQPQALKIFFLTEMWERFGFYTTQAMLVFFMIDKLDFSDADAYAVLGQFTALVYLGAVLGGWASDRFLGCRFAVMLGGLFLSIGYALLAFRQHTLFTALSLVVIGNSLLKPNISSFLGQFYLEKDSRREAGFTLFYVGINVGSLLGTSGAGYIRELAGWSACFGAAAFALLLSVGVFRWGYRYFEDKGLPPMEHIQTLGTFLKQRPSIILWFVGALTVVYFAMTSLSMGSYALYVFGLLFCLYVIKVSLKLDGIFRRRMLALLLLFFMGTVFWALWFQMFSVVNVFTDRVIDRSLGGYEVPTSVFLGIEPIFVLVFGALIAAIWQTGKIKLSVPVKFIGGIFILVLAMQILAWVISETSTVMLSSLWLVLFYFLWTMGELLVSPIGLSMVTEFAPKEYTGLMMGGWFISLGFGGKLTGIMATYASVPEGVTDLQSLNRIYHHAFQQYAWIGLMAFFVCLLFVPLIRKWLKN